MYYFATKVNSNNMIVCVIYNKCAYNIILYLLYMNKKIDYCCCCCRYCTDTLHTMDSP